MGIVLHLCQRGKRWFFAQANQGAFKFYPRNSHLWIVHRPGSLIREDHKAGRDIGYCHLEKLHNLEALRGDGFIIPCFPHEIRGASAGWTRAVAVFDEGLVAGRAGWGVQMRHNLRGDRMVTTAQIRKLSRRIAEQFDPEQIILFGSHASGRARGDSDVDLLVVMRCNGAAARKAAEILNRVEPEFAVDLLVRTPQELRKRLAQQDGFLADIVQHGKVLYETAHP